MPRLTDLAEVRRLLETDRRWAVYALGDLAPQRLPHSDWLHVPGDAPALVLLYRDFDAPVIFALGEADAVRPLIDEIAGEPKMYVHLPPALLDLLRPRYRIEEEADMWRMVLDPARFPRHTSDGVVPLRADDLPALRTLFADGEPAGEVPHFFLPSMLDDRTYFGIWEGSALVASGGTHMVEPELGIAAIGNIYTRRDRRGRGLGSRVMSAVTAELLRRELPTIALNVNQHNAAAIRVYERLGFVRYCPFKEGVAIRIV